MATGSSAHQLRPDTPSRGDHLSVPVPATAIWERQLADSITHPRGLPQRLGLDTDTLARHYAEHAEKPFFPGLLKFITSSPVLACAVQGPNSVTVCRTLIGATNGQKADPGTIRGDFGMSGANNMIHGSDSPESAERELALWFTTDELVAMDKTANQWIYDPSDLG